jgi:glycosyltransferase involved in cell wall biosynthesis
VSQSTKSVFVATSVLMIGVVYGHGGDAAQMLHLADELQQSGHHVSVIVPALPTTVELARRAAQRGVSLRRSRLLTSGRWSPIGQALLWAEIRLRYRPDVLHFHTGDICLPRRVTMFLRCAGRRRPVIVTVHSAQVGIDRTEPKMRNWLAAVPRRVAAIVAPSRHGAEAQLAAGIPASTVHTIYNGIPTTAFARGDGDRPREELSLSPDHRLMLFSSRLDDTKQPLVVFEAFRRVADEFPEVHLAFVGSGEHEQQLREAVSLAGLASRVHLLGYRSDVADWLAACDVWLLPTLSENFSLAVLEAMAARCAIVSTNCQGNDEVLVDGHNALLSEPTDLDGFCDAVQQLLADPALAAAIARQAQLDVARFTTERMAREYGDLYGLLAIPRSQS